METLRTLPIVRDTPEQTLERRERLFEEYSCGLDLADGWSLFEEGSEDYERNCNDDQE